MLAKFEKTVFNNYVIPDFVVVQSIEHNALPSISQNTTKIPGVAGNYYYGHEIDNRYITLKVLLKCEDSNVLPEKLTLLSEWLYTEEPKKLILGDDLNHYYMAKLDGTTGFEEIGGKYAEGTITFVCLDPHKYFIYQQVVPVPTNYTGDTIVCINNGTVPCNPRLELDIAKDITDISIISNDKSCTLGNMVTVGEESKVQPSGVRIPNSATTTNGWTKPATGLNGNLGGEIVSDRGKFIVVNNDYGDTNSAWHGPALEYNVGETQDFEYAVWFEWDSSKYHTMGRCNSVLTDKNGKYICVMELMKNTWAQDKGQIRFWFRYDKYNYYVNDIYFNKKSQKATIYYKITRKGKKWTIYVRDNDHNITLVNKTYYDNAGDYSAKVKYVRVGFEQCGDIPPLPASKCSRVLFTNYDTRTSDTNKTIPIIASKNDTLIFDFNTGEISKNGENMFKYIQPSSEYIDLDPMASGLMIYPPDAVKSGTITYTERCL